MKACAITIEGNEQSEASAARLIESSKTVGNEFDVVTFTATTPDNVADEMKRHGVTWNYPWEGTRDCGLLRLHAYNTTNRDARIACFMSHFRLWTLVREEPILILEDDAVFIHKLDPETLLGSHFHAIGINDPRGATRKSYEFHRAVQSQSANICATPWVDEIHVPQGLAGASAYLMKPEGAVAAICLTQGMGAWPNDALLCRQLCPWLGVTKTYHTQVQGTPSSLA